MSLIKDKRFAITLWGSTLVVVGGLVWYAMSSSGKYDAALETYRSNASAVANAEKEALYPTRQNLEQKSKALSDYREAVDGMQRRFAGFRPAELKKTPPPTFIDHLKAADASIRKEFAFGSGGTKLPPAFYFGFEAYIKGTPVKEDATGILGYQLDALNELFSKMAKTHPTEIRRVFRPKLPEEEEAKKWVAPAGCIARPLPVEITFKAREKSVREFLTSITATDKYYYVVRTMAISNERLTAPTQKDAQFDKAKSGGSGGVGDAMVFPGLGTDTSVFPGGGADSATPAAKPVVSSDSSRILKQVLGNEELVVFLRLDVLQFLPPMRLP